MSPEQILRELKQIARLLGRWQAQWRATIAAAGVLLGLWIFSLSDLLLRYGRGGRLTTWLLLITGVGVGIWAIQRAITHRRTAKAVAARVEHSFPQLDNHLINFVQFASLPVKNPIINAYLKAGVPEFSTLDIDAMKDRRGQHRALGALLAAVVLLGIPALWAGPAWSNALLRIVNPFSARSPTTLAQITSVVPGDQAILTGSPLLLECHADGRRGQQVYLEIWPADDQRSTIALGFFEEGGMQVFRHRIPRVTTDLRYRFRAGDDRSAIHRIQTLPPLAFTDVTINVIPPAYTGFEAGDFDLMSEHLTIPQGSEVTLRVQANRPLISVALQREGHEPLTLSSAGAGGAFAGRLQALSDSSWRLVATDANGFVAESALKLQILPDRPPTLRVTAPTGRTTLGPGMRPRITWETSDDYGLERIVLEQMEPDAKVDDPGWPVAEWDAAGRREFTATWTGTDPPAAGIPSVYRVTAIDNRPGEPNRTRSSLIVFDVGAVSDVIRQEKEAVSAGLESFSSMIELQRRTLQATEKLTEVLTQARPEQWRDVGIRQSEVRRLAGSLLANPAKPMGAMSETVRRLFHGPMTDVLDLISRVMTADGNEKQDLANRTVRMQTQILRLLTQMEASMEQTQENRDIAGLIALLESLLQSQARLIKDTESAVAEARSMERSLANRQDRLANDVFEFLRLSRSEARTLERNNKEFAETLLRVVAYCEDHQLPARMLFAAEHLEDGQASQALEPQHAALAILEDCMEMLNVWRADAAVERMELFQEAIEMTKEQFDKLIELQGQVVDSIRQVNQQRDMSGEDMDHLGSELAEIRDNIRDTLLELAADLHIFPELPVGNDLVQDVFQVFEDVEQTEGSETGDVIEINIGKNEDSSMEFLEAMEGFRERLEDMEMWLPAEPTRSKIEAESFDQEEFPNAIPVIPMASEMEDLIGDLLEKTDQGQNTDDDATNIGQPDVEAGWEVSEGQVTTYSAKGKSGNEAPDHREQDGRSNVGRQGMADGETAAGSGTIGEGDDDIVERMTQDSAQSGHVDEMGDDADAVATGGGKQSGHTEEMGMSGMGPRRDAITGEASEHGWAAMMRRDAEALYARASLSHVRTGSLDEAIRHLRHAEEAINRGLPMQQIDEHRKRATAALRRSLTELGPGIGSEAMALDYSPPHIEDQIVGAADEAPAAYRDLVSEYFKSLSNAP